MEYKQKYLKYKLKYLQLKKKHNFIGGMENVSSGTALGMLADKDEFLSEFKKELKTLK